MCRGMPPRTSTFCQSHLKAFTLERAEVIRGPFEKFVDWWQCAAVMQREAVTVMPNCSGGVDVVVA
jgi:hypothetical protein